MGYYRDHVIEFKSTAAIPRVVYVEGTEANICGIQLEYFHPDTKALEDLVKVTPVINNIKLEGLPDEKTIRQDGQTVLVEPYEFSTGAYLQVNTDKAVSNMKKLSVLKPSPDAGLPAESELEVTWPGDKLELYKTPEDLANGTKLSSPLKIKLNEFPAVANPILYYYANPVAPSETEKDILILSEYKCPDGTKCEDKIRLTILKVDYIRIFDRHRISNRTTRAINPDLRHKKEFEDNERSDVDLSDNRPVLRLGAWCNNMEKAEISFECKFLPESIGKYILWEVIPGNGCTVPDGNDKGDFSKGEKVDLELIPSSLERETHRPSDKDFKIQVGIDSNADGTLQGTEILEPEFAVSLIGKPEYDHCFTETGFWFSLVPERLIPHSTVIYDLFMSKKENRYDRKDENVEIKYLPDAAPGETYDQRDSLGVDETGSITQGKTDKYFWNQDNPFSKTTLKSDTVWGAIILAAIESMKIEDWYKNNPDKVNNVFTVNKSGSPSFNGDTYDLSFCFGGGAHIELVVSLDTEKTKKGIVVKAIRASGSGKDLWDWQSIGQDAEMGWLSRIQTCYQPACGRRAGKIPKIELQLDMNKYEYPKPPPFNDYNKIRQGFKKGVGK